MTLVKNFILRFRSSEFAKNTAILTLGTIVAQGITVAAMPILSRLYTPSDFGLLAVFMAASGIVGTVITLRFDAGILLPKDEHEAKTLVLLSGILALLFGIAIGFIIWLIPYSIKSKMGILVLNDWFLLATFCGITTALMSVGSTWYNRQQDYVKMTQLRVTQSTVCAVLGISLGLWGIHSGLMLAQIVAGFIMAVIVLTGFCSLQINWQNHNFWKIAKKHSTSPKYLLPTSLLDVFTLQIPIFLITAWFSNEAAGQFSMAWKILALPASLIGTAVGQVFLQRFSTTWPDVEQAKRLLFRTWKTLAAIGILPTIIVALFGDILFGWILGEAWQGAGSMATIIAPMLFAILISSPTSGIYLVLKLQKISLYFGISFLIYRAGCMYLGLIYNNLYIGLMAWVVCELAAILIYNLIALRRMRLS